MLMGQCGLGCICAAPEMGSQQLLGAGRAPAVAAQQISLFVAGYPVVLLPPRRFICCCHCCCCCCGGWQIQHQLHVGLFLWQHALDAACPAGGSCITSKLQVHGHRCGLQSHCQSHQALCKREQLEVCLCGLCQSATPKRLSADLEQGFASAPASACSLDVFEQCESQWCTVLVGWQLYKQHSWQC